MFSEFHGVQGLVGRTAHQADFPAKSDHSKFVVFSYEDHRDCTGVFLETIWFYLDSHFPIIYVGLGQNVSHYRACFERQGHNVERLERRGLLTIMNGLELFLDLYEEYCGDGTVSSDNPLSIIYNSKQPERLKPLYDKICVEISRIKARQNPRATKESGGVLVIDDLNVLLQVGIEASAIMDFIQYCRREISSTFEDGNLIVKINRIGRDPKIEKLALFLGHVSDLYLDLKSCAEEHEGELTLEQKKPRHFNRKIIPIHYVLKGSDFKLYEM